MTFLRVAEINKKAHYVVFLIVVLLGVVASRAIYLEEYERAEIEQKALGAQFVDKLHNGLSLYSSALSSIASFIQSSREDISPQHFSQFVRHLSIPHNAGVYFTQFVPDSQKIGYEARQKIILKDDSFAIHPRESRAEYLPLTLGYPDKISYGYDTLSSQYQDVHIVNQVRSSLSLTLSEPTRVFLSGQEYSKDSNAFILSLPIYLPIESRPYKLADDNGFHGIVSAYFEIGSILDKDGFSQNSDLFYRISSVNKASSSIWFSEFSDDSEWEEGEYDTQTLFFAGQEWRIDTRRSVELKELVNWNTVSLSLSLFLFSAVFLFFYIKKSSRACLSLLTSLNKRIETDELTGLLSRSQIQQHLTDFIEESKGHDQVIATLVLDLDHFKTINDAFGHEIGDQLLIRVAQRLNSVLPEDAIIGYLGGDAYVVLLTSNDKHDIHNLETIAKEVIQQISQSYFVDGRTLNIGCSIGVALYPEFGTDAVTLIKNADMAVYKAKTLGRATYHFYDGEMGKLFARNVRIETRLRQALLDGEFELHFQPKVDIITEECVGLEALLRWEDSELGIVSPAEFIPIAEQTGIILALGEWVLEQAFRHIVEWKEQGITVPPVAINCSAAQLKRNDFLPNLLALLDKYKVDPSSLEIEVTESILIEDAESCAELLRQIRRTGIKLAIDDFGTGYSSLSYLKDLPFDYIKIDQVFIRNMTEERNHAALTHAIIGLSHNLNLTVIAEGITNIDQLIMLQEFGCDIGQGYLFSKAFGANSMGTDPMIVALNDKGIPND